MVENKAGGVAILRLENGEYLISIWDEEKNSSAYLCAKNWTVTIAVL